MELRFWIDPETDLPHIYHHGVSEAEVAWILANPLEVMGNRNDSKIAIGRTSGQRLLKVVFVPDDDEDSAFVVTAHRLSGKELNAHNRRMRHRR